MDDQSPEDLLSDAVDALALGYPLDGSDAAKSQWMMWLQGQVERRALTMRAERRPTNKAN